MSRILSLRDVQRTYGEPPVAACAGVSLEIDDGEFVAIVGPSGSGKSTLLNLIGTLDRPSAGTVEIDGVDVGSLSDAKLSALRASRIGFVFQQYNLVPFLTVEENIALPFLLDHEPAPHDLVRDLIESFGLSRCSRTPARLLSGGEQQRTALCRALARHPDIVFADEPTGALDSQSTQIVLGTLRRMADEGQMIIMVTHDLDAAAMADRIVIMHDGRTVRHLGRCTNQELLQFMTDPKA